MICDYYSYLFDNIDICHYIICLQNHIEFYQINGLYFFYVVIPNEMA